MDPSRLKTTRNIANLKQGRNDWYKILKNQADPSRTSVMLYDEIGWFGVTAQDFINDLKQVTGPIDLHLNSPGGEVFDGIAIHAFLAARGNVTTYVDSLAASIASVIAMAGTEIVMGRNASFMVHDGFGMCIGNAADMREQAELLERVSDNIASIYADRTGKPKDDWRAAMLAETWYIGQEAVDAGLADRLAVNGAAPENPDTVVPGTSPDEDSEWQPMPGMAAHFDLSIFRNVPERLKNQVAPASETPDAISDTVQIDWNSSNSANDFINQIRQHIRVRNHADSAAPPPLAPEPSVEAPAEPDRGFVVPGAEIQGEPGPEPESQPASQPVEQEPAMDTARVAEELLALMRDGFKKEFGRSPTPLGMDTMPLLNKALAVHHTATTDETWDGPAAVAAMPNDDSVLRYCHAWMSDEAAAEKPAEGDDDADDQKSSYKMPHHKTKGGPANLAACRNGLARLPNADIPDSDRAGVKAHLQAHLDDADKDDDEGSGDTKNHTHTEFNFVWDPSMTAALKEAMQ
jgi:ATP-dependent protease ClpP protease subunit